MRRERAGATGRGRPPAGAARPPAPDVHGETTGTAGARALGVARPRPSGSRAGRRRGRGEEEAAGGG